MHSLSLSKEDILKGLRRIDALAKESNLVVDLSIYGGAALVLVFDLRTATRDVGAVISGDIPFVRQASALVAEENGWPEDWLNDGVKGFVSGKEQKLLMECFDPDDSGGLRVYTRTPE